MKKNWVLLYAQGILINAYGIFIEAVAMEFFIN